VQKKVAWSGAQFQGLDGKGAYTVWNPVHFQAEYADLVRGLLPIPAHRVLLATVPHVTVAPIATGVNPASPGQKWREGSRYFPYYTDPWIAESDFRPDKHRHITHQQARAIDSAIDQYNDTIQDHVRRARADGRDWHLVDLCGILDGVAYRRLATSRCTAAGALPSARPIAGLDTRFYRSDETGRLRACSAWTPSTHHCRIRHHRPGRPSTSSAPPIPARHRLLELLAQDTLNSSASLTNRLFTLRPLHPARRGGPQPRAGRPGRHARAADGLGPGVAVMPLIAEQGGDEVGSAPVISGRTNRSVISTAIPVILLPGGPSPVQATRPAPPRFDDMRSAP
jgi:hypothetical protein